jgi:hypothetical protein
MHAWLQYELGGAVRVKDQRVVSVQHLPGARDALRMETVDDIELGPMKITNAMSGNRKNMLEAGMVLDAGYIEKEYGLSPQLLKLFVPIECPKMCLTPNGVLRPWTLDVNLGREQASALQRVIRTAFWQAVEDFNTDYARRLGGKKYPQVDMIEEFCLTTSTPDIYVDAIRREWQRRLKSGQSRHIQPENKEQHVTLADLG